MKKILLAVGFWIGVTSSIFAQNKINSATKKYDQLAYIDAIKVYEKVVEKGHESQDLYQHLGDAYYFNAQYTKAIQSYGQLINKYPNQAPEYYFRYAIALKSEGKYELSDRMMQEFYKRNAQDSRANLFVQQPDYLQEINNNSGRYTLENSGINSENSDYGTAFYQDKIIFTTARDKSNLIKRVHTWTGESFTTLYQADVSKDGSVANPKKFASVLDSKFHEATPAFTADGTTMYFTRNNYINGKKGTNTDKTVLLKVYKATLINNKWQNIVALPFNSDNYNCAHPVLSPDQITLYFVSDMPGTLGQSDLFKVEVKNDGSFGTPINLGPEINTEGRETFPFIDQNNVLYFATDGRPGLGGLDVFAAQHDANGNYKYVQNLGEPINSTADDFAFAIKNDSIGFVTSNREGGLGNDDIYKFIQNQPIKNNKVTAVTGTLIDTYTNEPIPDAKLTIYDQEYKNPIEVTTNDKGQFEIPQLDINTKYVVKTEKPGYNTKETPVVFPSSGNNNLHLNLDPTQIPIKPGDDLAKIFKIEIIYFDLDKSNIRPDAARDLAKIVEVMKQYPSMKIDVRSHTDSRASKIYNEKLSDIRAKSTIAWMISQGIDKNRLTGRGYGESQLVNKCADGVECTEAEHQLNRRSQFIITEM